MKFSFAAILAAATAVAAFSRQEFSNKVKARALDLQKRTYTPPAPTGPHGKKLKYYNHRTKGM